MLFTHLCWSNGFNEDKVKEWEQNLIRAREEYSLEKFLTKNRSKSADKRDLYQNYNNYGFHSPQSDLGEKRSLVDRDTCLTLKKRKASLKKIIESTKGARVVTLLLLLVILLQDVDILDQYMGINIKNDQICFIIGVLDKKRSLSLWVKNLSTSSKRMITFVFFCFFKFFFIKKIFCMFVKIWCFVTSLNRVVFCKRHVNMARKPS